jgi:hypothetical protein
VTRTGDGQMPLTIEEKNDHVLNRLAYGPSVEDLQWVHNLGLAGYIERQLHPESIDESNNAELNRREALLFTGFGPVEDTWRRCVGDLWPSCDGSRSPNWIAGQYRPLPPPQRISGVPALQQLVHVRGVYSRRQLQAVLAEFWENHFTTDYDKVADYFTNLRNSDAHRAMSESQAASEAAQVEYLEYEFFHQNALGDFGDLLLFSATSPSRLIYLDNVLNVKSAANMNYAREILELFAFGAGNRHTQQDIEQLAKCFTGWTVRKVRLEEKLAYPASARAPPTQPGVVFDEVVLLDVGPGWKFAKGTREPSPASDGTAATAWTQTLFDDTAWLDGATSIGYGDDDDNTVLADMRSNYVSVVQYLRIAASGEDFRGARTALSATVFGSSAKARTRLSVLLRVRRCRAVNQRLVRGPAFRQSAGRPSLLTLPAFRHVMRITA